MVRENSEKRKTPPLARAAMLPTRYRTTLDTTSFSTPEKLRSAVQGLRAGRPQVMMQILQEVENNLYLGGILRTRKIAPSRLKWQVRPGIEGDANSEAIAADCEQMLKGINLRRIILHMQDAVMKPYAVHEILWDNAGTKVVPSELLPRMASEFTFDYERTGEELRLLTDLSHPEGDLMIPMKWMVHYSLERGQTLAAEGGLSKGVAFHWLLMINLLINWIHFTEKYGEPTRWAKYDPNLVNEEQLNAIEDSLISLGPDAVAMFPNTVDMMMQEAQRYGSVNAFESLISVLERDIAIGILGQVLTSSGSDDGSGSLALGEVHNEVRHDLIEFDGANISETLTKTLLRWYVFFNFGEQAAYPEFVLLTDPPQDTSATLLSLQTAQNMGYEITAGQMSELLDMELPKGINADDILQPRSATSGFNLPVDFSQQTRSKLTSAHRKRL